jgi:hypothetical protein
LRLHKSFALAKAPAHILPDSYLNEYIVETILMKQQGECL